MRASCVHFFKQTRLGTLCCLIVRVLVFSIKTCIRHMWVLKMKKSPKKKIKQYKLFYYFSLSISEEATASVAVAQVVRILLKTWAWLKLPYNQKEKNGRFMTRRLCEYSKATAELLLQAFSSDKNTKRQYCNSYVTWLYVHTSIYPYIQKWSVITLSYSFNTALYESSYHFMQQLCMYVQ